MSEFHFISGLPRSGSTLLASILCQNPEFIASIQTPVGYAITTLQQAIGHDNEGASFITPEQRADMLRAVFHAYYKGAPRVVFDNNRRWTANMPLLMELFPECKVICCVRAPAAIIDSLEYLREKDPLGTGAILNGQTNLNIYDRVRMYMKPDAVFGFAYNSLREAFYGPHKNRLLLITYDDLARFPVDIMRDLHLALELEPFAYDFDNIEPIPGAATFDKDLSTPGLHNLKKKVVYEPRDTVLPPDIFNSLPKPFWLNKPVTPAP
jgi:sulfotransferase